VASDAESARGRPWKRRGPLVEDIQRHLRKAIFEGRYPPGTRLRQEQLAEELNVSRTPLREALRVLQNEGTLTSTPGRGVEVPPASLDDLLAASQFREALEGVAARLAAEGPGKALRPRLEKVLNRQHEVLEEGDDMVEFSARDADFHVAIVEATGNKYLPPQSAVIRMTTQVFRHLLLGYRRIDAERSIADHRRIAEAIYQGDGIAAEHWARAHIRIAIAAVADARASGPWRPTDGAAAELSFFSEEEARTLAAAADRIFPADDSSPGASALGAVEFLDRQLAGSWGAGEKLYREGPFLPSPDGRHGWQSPLTPADAYRQGLRALDRVAQERHGSPFADLAPGAQDALLTACQRGEAEADFGENLSAAEFFRLLRVNVVEGLFSDPRHGGNRDGRGWRWLGFPAAHAAYAIPQPDEEDGTAAVEEP
jgi:gluconate 2-dehydrogenase gamma chain